MKKNKNSLKILFIGIILKEDFFYKKYIITTRNYIYKYDIMQKTMEVKTMNKYKCTICGYIYDEEAEGVKFEDLPEDWSCPLCGVGKELFEKLED